MPFIDDRLFVLFGELLGKDQLPHAKEAVAVLFEDSRHRRWRGGAVTV
jgi:hypothetical protein